MHGPSVVAERRSVERHSAKERAVAILDGSVLRGCIVINFSDKGARLSLGAPHPLPLRFELLFPTGQRVKVALIWQRETDAGVMFERPLTAIERLIARHWLRSAEAETARRIP